jgi:hypothetical protein
MEGMSATAMAHRDHSADSEWTGKGLAEVVGFHAHSRSGTTQSQ